MAQYELLLRDSALAVIGYLWPLEGQLAPSSIRWTRNWRTPGILEIVIPRDIALAADLVTLGNFIEVRRDGDFEALYLLGAVKFDRGSVAFTRGLGDLYNAVYLGGQGEGRNRELLLRENVASIAEAGRIEKFIDARDVELGMVSELTLRADAALANSSVRQSALIDVGNPVSQDTITVYGVNPMVYAAGRVVLPPPATREAGSNFINIQNDEYDRVNSVPADVAMSHYVSNHMVAPADSTRQVPNLAAPNPGGILPNVSVSSRFQTVLEILQELALTSESGFEITLVGNWLEFTVIPERDRTAASSVPVIFRDDEVLLDIAGRAYREHWDVGDLITFELGGGTQIDLHILEVAVRLQAGQAIEIAVALEAGSLEPGSAFGSLLKGVTEQGKALARVETRAGGDANAIHDNISSEIAAIAEKVAPANADLVLIEDSIDGYTKKKVQVGNLPGGGGSTPTGTGFRHVTGGVEDAAAKLVDTADINADQVTYSRIQNVSAISRLLGRGSAAGAGDVEEISLGTNLSMAGTVLNASGAGGTLNDAYDFGGAGAGRVVTVDTGLPVTLEGVTDYGLLWFQQNADAAPRLSIYRDGKLEWGSGGGAADVVLQRAMANVLALAADDTLRLKTIDTAAGDLLVRSATGVIDLIHDGGAASMRVTRYQDGAAGAWFEGLHARGTEALPTAVLTGDDLVVLEASGHSGVSFVTGGQLVFEASENWAGAAWGTQMRLLLVQVGSFLNSTQIIWSVAGGVITVAHERATILSTVAGDLTLDPAGNIDALANTLRVASLDTAAGDQVTRPATGVFSVIRDGGAAGSYVTRYQDSVSGAQFVGRHARGSEATPTVLLSGDDILVIDAVGYRTGAFITGGQLVFEASENWGAVWGTQMKLRMVATGGFSLADQIIWSVAGGIITVAYQQETILFTVAGDLRLSPFVDIDADGNAIENVLYQDFDEGVAPGTPPAGHVRLYAKTDGSIASKDDLGVETVHGAGGGGSVATDVIWDADGDLAVGSGADTAARLARGAAGSLLQPSGTTLAWTTAPTIAGLLTLSGGAKLAAAQTIQDSGGSPRILLATASQHITLTGDVNVDGNLKVGTGPFGNLHAYNTNPSTGIVNIGGNTVFTPATASVTGLQCQTVCSPAGAGVNNIAIAGYAKSGGGGAGSFNNLIGLQFYAQAGGVVNTTSAKCIEAKIQVTSFSGTLTNSLAVDIPAIVVAGGVPTIVNAWGIRVGDQGHSSETNVYGGQILRQTAGTNRYGLAVGDMSGGTLAYGVQIDAFDASAAGTQYPFAYGDVGSEHTYINREGAITVTQFVTLGNPVLTLTSLATNDDPVEILYQNRLATTDGTANQTLHTFAIPTSTTVTIEVWVIAKRSTTEQGAGYQILATYKNVAGVVTLIGAARTNTAEDVAGWDCNLFISGTNVLCRVTGAAASNITWHLTARLWKVST